MSLFTSLYSNFLVNSVVSPFGEITYTGKSIINFAIFGIAFGSIMACFFMACFFFNFKKFH